MYALTHSKEIHNLAFPERVTSDQRPGRRTNDTGTRTYGAHSPLPLLYKTISKSPPATFHHHVFLESIYCISIMAKFDGETEGKAVVEAFAKDVEGKTCISMDVVTPFVE
jgi:hypothetical protein